MHLNNKISRIVYWLQKCVCMQALT